MNRSTKDSRRSDGGSDVNGQLDGVYVDVDVDAPLVGVYVDVDAVGVDVDVPLDGVGPTSGARFARARNPCVGCSSARTSDSLGGSLKSLADIAMESKQDVDNSDDSRAYA